MLGDRPEQEPTAEQSHSFRGWIEKEGHQGEGGSEGEKLCGLSVGKSEWRNKNKDIYGERHEI